MNFNFGNWWSGIGTTSGGSSTQNISSTDALCEGPIYGLVNGEGSVYLNDNPAMNAEFYSFSPFKTEQVGGQTSGTITFSGGTLGQVDANTFLPTDLVISNSVPRTLYLLDETAGVGNVAVFLGTPVDSGDAWSISLSSPGAFTNYHTTSYEDNVSYLITGEQEINGSFTFTSSSFGTFRWKKTGPIIDPDNYNTSGTLETAIKVKITAIDATNGTISVDSTLTGTFRFLFDSQKSFSAQEGRTGSSTFNPDDPINNIENLYVQENTGTRDQVPIRDIGSVGGSVVIQGSTNGVNLPNLKMLDPNSASGYQVTLFDIQGMPNVPTSFNDDYPGNPDYSDTNADPTIINTSDFGLDTAAKIQEVDKLLFTIEYPQGLYSQNTEDGNKQTCYAFYDIRIEFQLAGSSSWTNEQKVFGQAANNRPLWQLSTTGLVKHYGKKTSALSFQHVIVLSVYDELDYTNFRIKIFRVTRHAGLPINSAGTRGRETDKGKYQVVCAAALTTLQAVIDDNFRYPYTAVVNTTFSSKNFKQPPRRSYEIMGKLVKIPDSYTPREFSPTGKAEYSDFWGGTFKEKLYYTNNPAWIFYDLVTNNRYGAGKWIEETDIDKYALYRISKFCDELVDSYKPIKAINAVRGEYYKITSLGDTNWNDAADTTGVTYSVDDILRVRRIPEGTGRVSLMEPRFQMNTLISQGQPVYKVLKDMASAFTSMLYWMNGQLTLVQDVPQGPVAVFTKGNVIDGAFSYESSSIKTRINQVVVFWNDPTINYERVPVIVEDAGDIIRRNKTISTDVVAYGCTSESQAIRYGKWKLWTAQNQREIVNFSTGLEGLFVRPGDVISIQDSTRKGFDHSGRISSATSSSITVDRTVSISSGSSYELYVTHSTPVAIYTGQSTVTINGTSYSTGDILPEAYIHTSSGTTLVSLDTEEYASNAVTQSGTALPTEWKPYVHSAPYDVTNSAGDTTSITISGTFTKTPTAGAVWGLKQLEGGVGVTGSSKLYKIIDVRYEDKNIVQISAAEHFNSKFTSVEEEYELGTVPESVTPDEEPEVIPPPQNLSISATGPEKAEESELTLSWVAPNTPFVASFEVVTNIEGEGGSYTPSTEKTFIDLPANKYSFKVRTVSPKGKFSTWVSVEYESNYQGPLTNTGDYTHGLPKWITSSSPGVIEREITTTASEEYSLSAPKFYVAEFSYTVSGLTKNYYQYYWNDALVYTGSGGLSIVSVLNKDTNEYEKGTFVTTISGTNYYKIKSKDSTGAQGAEVFKFKNYPVDIASSENPGKFVTISTAIPNGKVDLSGVIDNDPRELYIVFDESVPRVFLGEWDTNANTAQSPPFWRDANEPMTAAWTALTATSASISANTNKLVGVGTNFSSEVNIGDIISLANLSTQTETLGEAAKVINIDSNTSITLDRVFSNAINLTYIYRNTFRPNKSTDAIVADISRPT